MKTVKEAFENGDISEKQLIYLIEKHDLEWDCLSDSEAKFWHVDTEANCISYYGDSCGGIGGTNGPKRCILSEQEIEIAQENKQKATIQAEKYKNEMYKRCSRILRQQQECCAQMD